ncbi:MAG: serine/threonine-protein kinase [Planctomycetota bacterium]|nr:serine/threonine-protein kinase [Planctomycetota bacterium]
METRQHIIRELFVQAAMRSPIEREAFIASQCEGDPDLLREIRSLLEFHQPESTFLETPAMGNMPASSSQPEVPGSDLPPGTLLGKFTLLRVLGAGGMGVVYEAEQTLPRRRVALKVVRPGLLVEHLARRFRAEAQALAMLQHPGIAQIYEAGTERTQGIDIPYLAMELVEGRTLTEHARQEQLGMRGRLELFVRVAEAVSHAHQRGVIHRDLKPANVMVTRSGDVKVLDFGIARFTENEAMASLATSSGQVLGTLSYMSPEQASGDPLRIDVRADVYALGAMLYELLADRLPLDLSKCSLVEGVRRLSDEEPSSLGTINRSLRGDLETIVAKAIEKDATRRYPSAAEFLEDVRRYLNDEPIHARPASTWYQVRKFTRRNRFLVGGVAGVFLALLAGLSATLWQASRTVDALSQAQRESDVSQSALAFMVQILASGDPGSSLGKDPSLRAVLEMAASRIEHGEIKSERVVASVAAEVGKAFGNLGDYRRAEMLQRRALEAERTVFGPRSSNVISRISSIGYIMQRQGRAQDSLPLLREAYAMAMSDHGPRSECLFEIMLQLGNALEPAPEGTLFYERAYTMGRELWGARHPSTLMAMSNLGYSLDGSGQHEKAVTLLRECMAINIEVNGRDNRNTLSTMVSLGAALLNSGQGEAGCSTLEEALAIEIGLIGAAHPDILNSKRRLITAYWQTRQIDRAEKLAREVLAQCGTDLNRPSRVRIESRGMLVTLLVGRKQFDEALQLCETQLIDARTTFGTAPDVHEPDDGIVMSWSLFYDLFQSWGKDKETAVWRDRIATTKLGRQMLAAEAAQSQPQPAK